MIVKRDGALVAHVSPKGNDVRNLREAKVMNGNSGRIICLFAENGGVLPKEPILTCPISLLNRISEFTRRDFVMTTIKALLLF